MSQLLTPKIAPSILSADFARLASECQRMVDCGADYLHVDVMDGHFVPNLTIGAPVVKSLRSHTSAFLDCHLMVSHPERWISDFALAGCNMYTFHIESTSTPHVLIQEIKKSGMRVGVALKPGTSVESVVGVCESVDMVLVMTVEPGFGGQSFMPETLRKVSHLRSLYPLLDIQVDGGIGPGESIEAAARAGANVVVAGTSIFKSADPRETIRCLRETVQGSIEKRSGGRKEEDVVLSVDTEDTLRKASY